MFLYAVLSRTKQQKPRAVSDEEAKAMEGNGSFALKSQHGGQFKPRLFHPLFTVHIVPRGQIENEQQRPHFLSS